MQIKASKAEIHLRDFLFDENVSYTKYGIIAKIKSSTQSRVPAESDCVSLRVFAFATANV